MKNNKIFTFIFMLLTLCLSLFLSSCGESEFANEQKTNIMTENNENIFNSATVSEIFTNSLQQENSSVFTEEASGNEDSVFVNGNSNLITSSQTEEYLNISTAENENSGTDNFKTDSEHEYDNTAAENESVESENFTSNVAEQENEEDQNEENILYITIEGTQTVLTATLAENSSAEALKDLLSENSLSVEMRDYGNFEKVGSLGYDLPQNNEQITTVPGDVILYQGNQITIYYDTNSWNFTRLGKIEDINKEELLGILGEGDVAISLSLKE